MMSTEQMHRLAGEPEQMRTMRTARGLRALAAALLVTGLTAAIIVELPFGRSTVASQGRSGEAVGDPAPANAPARETPAVPRVSPVSPEEFEDRSGPPPSVIVG